MKKFQKKLNFLKIKNMNPIKIEWIKIFIVNHQKKLDNVQSHIHNKYILIIRNNILSNNNNNLNNSLINLNNKFFTRIWKKNKKNI